MASETPEKGDKVSWQWGGGAPSGKVVDKKDEGEIAIKSKRGNTIKKNASPDNPAVHVGRSGNDVVKRASELTVEDKASGTSDKKHDREDGDEAEVEKEEAKEPKKQKTTKKETKKEPKKETKKKEDSKEEKKEEKEEEKAEKEAEKEADKTEDKKDDKKETKKETKKEPKKAEKKVEKKVEKKAEKKEETKEDKKDTDSSAPKSGRGRPKKGSTTGPNAKKEAKPRSIEGIGSRTRSRA